MNVANKKVLIIDDDPEFVDAISNLLDAKGYAVHSASSGAEGIDKARNLDPDIILLDVMMSSRTEGIDVAGRIDSDEELKKIPIIMISGIRREMNLPFGLEPDKTTLPVKVFLEKPVKPEVLLNAVAENIR